MIEMKELDYLLYIIENIGELKPKFWRRAARILLSSIIRKEIIDDKSFEVIIKRGKEEGFIISDKSGQITLTPNGKVYLKHILGKLVFKDEIYYQIQRIKDLDKIQREEYIKSLMAELKNTLEYNQSKRQLNITSTILVNGYLGKIDGTFWKIKLTSKEYIKKESFSAKGTLIRPLLDSLKEIGYVVISKLGYKDFTIFLDRTPENEVKAVIKKYNFKVSYNPKKFQISDMKKDEFEFFLAQVLSNYLIENKLTKIGQRLKFIDFSKKYPKKVSIGNVSTYLTTFHGFNIQISRIGDKKFLLWMDPTYMEFLTLDKLIEIMDIQTEKDLLEKLTEIQVLPTRKKGKLVSANLQQKIPQKIRDYWMNKYGLKLESKMGMAKVQFESGDIYDYPLETLSVSKEWINQNIGFISKETPTLTPYNRYRKIIYFFNRFFSSVISTPFGNVTLKKDIASLEEIGEIFLHKYRLLPPIMVFSKRDLTKRSTDSRAIFKFGGYSERKGIYIFKIICPSSISRQECEEFLNALKRIYDNTFGNLEYSDLDEIRLAYSDDLWSRPREKIYETMKTKLQTISPPIINHKKVVTVVIVPSKKHIFYYIAKSLINDLWQIPDQHIRKKNFSKVLKWDLPIIRGLSLHLYVKCLKSNEPAWILRCPSDGRGETVYCGIGFSMQPRRKNVRKSIGVLAICDAQGKYVFQKILSLSKMTYYLSEELLERITDFVQEIIEKSLINFRRLVIYKKGHLTEKERENVFNFIKKLKTTKFWENKIIDVITVKEDIFRLFKQVNGKLVNVDPGTTLIFKNNNHALICTSGHPELGVSQGTAKILHIRVELAESKRSIQDLIREYYDRTFLNWTAPVTLSKFPPELNVSQKIADLSREIQIKKEFTYLVM